MKHLSMNQLAEMRRKYFPLSWKDLGKTVLLLLCAYGTCFLLHGFSAAFSNESMIFLLALMLIARWTEGYFYDIVSSVLAVICVNFSFTYPYYVLNFSLTGYPLVFIVMLSISLMVSTLTSRAKQRDKMHEQIVREQMYNNLLRSVSHDIRTPLTSIVGSASAIIDNADKLTEQQRNALLHDMKDEAQWLIRVVENILSITRIGGCQSEIHKTPELAEEVISSAVRKLQKMYPDEEIRIQLPDSVFFIEMDPILIEQVILNLLENAVLHAEGHTWIAISLEKRETDVLLTVSDNGCGVPSKMKKSILDLSDTESANGQDIKRSMGIGLSVCKSIVLAHGGKVMKENLPQGGAAFSFTLPL
ncbi:MAG: DUF4118 domain-containing protein [Ruminococcus sp.]